MLSTPLKVGTILISSDILHGVYIGIDRADPKVYAYTMIETKAEEVRTMNKMNQVVVLVQLLLEKIDNLPDVEDCGGAFHLIEHLEAYLVRAENNIDSND